MSEKLMSKKEIMKLLKEKFHNDERITDELLFDGKRMTPECFVLLKSLDCDGNSYRNCSVDNISFHFYVTYEIPHDKTENKLYHERNLLKDDIAKLTERLDKLVDDDECYFVSDSFYGERDRGDNHGNRNHPWNSDSEFVTVDIWLFSKAGQMTAFVDSNSSKSKLLLESEL